jgi:glutathione reductase (NADPH)
MVAFTSPRIAQTGIMNGNIKTKDFSKWITYYRNHENVLIKTSTENGIVTGGAVMALEAEEVINYIANAVNQKSTHESLKKILWSYPSYASDLTDMI